MDDILIAHGGEIKANKDGKVEGYLVRFGSKTDTDLEGEFFNADTDFGIHNRLPLYYNHGADKKIKKQRIGVGEYKLDETGLWFESQVEMVNEYVQMLYEKGIVGKQLKSVGYSSGAIGHLVEREKQGKAHWLKTWVLGEASITPTPAEHRNLIMPIKSFFENLFEGKSSGLSYENKMDILRRAIQTKAESVSTSEYPPYCHVTDLYDTTVVYWEDGKLYEASYSLDGMSATLGTPKEVMRLVSYKPAPGGSKRFYIEECKTARLYEDLLGDLGFPNAAQVALASQGWKALHQRDSEDEQEAQAAQQRQAHARLLESQLLTGVRI